MEWIEIDGKQGKCTLIYYIILIYQFNAHKCHDKLGYIYLFYVGSLVSLVKQSISSVDIYLNALFYFKHEYS